MVLLYLTERNSTVAIDLIKVLTGGGRLSKRVRPDFLWLFTTLLSLLLLSVAIII